MKNEEKKAGTGTPRSDLAGTEAALRRAGLRAREIARHSAGYVVVYRNGNIVKDLVD